MTALSGTQTSKNTIISDVVLGITTLVTAAAMWYLMRKMRQVKPEVIYARRKARQAKMERAGFMPYGGSNDSAVFNPRGSETNIPLNPTSDSPYRATTPYQQWDKDGRAIGYAGDPRLLSPQPQRPAARMPTYQTESGGLYNSSGQRYDEEGGTSYPQGSKETAGRSALRQESGDSVGSGNQQGEGASEAIRLPRITASPRGIRDSPTDSFESAPATTRQTSYSPPLVVTSSSPTTVPPRLVQPYPQTQYANYHPSTLTDNVTSPYLPNPFSDTTPTQFNHPQVPFYGHTSEGTNATLYPADERSRQGTEDTSQGRAFSPPPPSYQTPPR